MKTWVLAFNFNLLLALILLSAGCQTTKDEKPASKKLTSEEKKKAKQQKKDVSTISFYLEQRGPGTELNVAPVFREKPINISIEGAPFLDLGSLAEADIVEAHGGFAVRLRFDSHGTFVLDNTTTANKGKRIVIFAKFPEPRWLAAPIIHQRNASGALTFTPDANREETERLVRGLKNAIVIKNKSM